MSNSIIYAKALARTPNIKTMMTTNEILIEIEKRDQFLDKDNIKDADQIEEMITKELIDNFNDYPVDFIIETLTKFGQAPNLVYDDNGRFAVSSDGYNQVVTDDELIDQPMTIFVEKHMWYKTIREALYHYLTYSDDETPDN